MRTRTILILLLIIAQLIGISCTKNKAEWKGTIEEVDGVTIVNNPLEPIYEEDIFHLEEELTIRQPEGVDKYIFSEIISIAVDDNGRIYILDRKEVNVKIFDKEGIYLKTIGKKGQGPGEMTYPYQIFITARGEIMVNDSPSYSLLFFSKEGEFIRSISTKKTVLLEPIIDSKLSFIGLRWERNIKDSFLEVNKFDSNLNFQFKIGQCDAPNYTSFNPFWIKLQFAITKNDQIIFGCPRDYTIQIFSPDGILLRKIKKEYEQTKIESDEIEEETKKADPRLKLIFPTSYSAYGHLTVDEKERIIVQTWERKSNEMGYFYDVFDLDGKYIAKIHLKVKPLIWKNNKLYTIESDEDGYHEVKRYRITWKY